MAFGPTPSQPLASLGPGEEEMLSARVLRVTPQGAVTEDDTLAVEEPLEIRLGFGPAEGRQQQPISLTMRTPGYDRDLAAGFLYTEGIVRSREDIAEVRSWGRPQPPGNHRNGVVVELAPEVPVDLARLQHHFYTTSSCGVCGKASLDALTTVGPDRKPLALDFQVEAPLLLRLPQILRAEQEVFGRTGGLHGCALFEPEGVLLCVREDVGRHNALDKLVGAQLLGGKLPLSRRILLLSGRASFELLQKAFMAGVPLVAAVGAPSSLAVELAQRFGITLVGWLRGERFTVYTHQQRVRLP